MGQTKEIMSIKQRTKVGKSQTEWAAVARQCTMGRGCVKHSTYSLKTHASVRL